MWRKILCSFYLKSRYLTSLFLRPLFSKTEDAHKTETDSTKDKNVELAHKGMY